MLRVLCRLLLLLSCSTAAVAGEEVQQVRHRNGLVVALPADLVVTETHDGFVVDPGAFRSLGPVGINLRPAGADSEEGWTGSHTIGARSVRYRVDYLGEDGSGGAEYMITAWESSSAGDIVYKQWAQSELGEPDFELFWRIVDQTRIPGGN